MNNLPDEIFMNILYNIRYVDIINIYKVSKKYRELINIEIDKYLNIRNEIKKEKDKLSNILSYFETKILYYIYEDEIDEKNKMLKMVNELFMEHDILRRIIIFYLKCYNCNYLYNTNSYNNFYECVNCELTYCQKCCIKCYNCDPYKRSIYYHCLCCKSKCFKEIKKEINETYKLNIKENDIIKKQQNKEYINDLKLIYCKNIIKLIDEDGIEDIYVLIEKIII